ncbi:MAG: type II toxin-antitoxin system VapC family toxin [Bacteroidota bacterium]
MLLDSDILIYSAQPAAPERARIQSFLREHAEDAFFVSEISRVEVYGFHALSDREEDLLNQVYNASTELSITPVLARAVSLRRQRRGLKTPDALVAATALHYGLPLVTRNTKDFGQVKGLEVIDPLQP